MAPDLQTGEMTASQLGPPGLKQTHTLSCPKSMVGRVIGKGGETIKSLQQYTGALLQIDQSCDPTKVTIAGTPSSVQLAVSMVNDIVQGQFKGFALLRQITQRSGNQALAQPQPVYVEGYGFVPLSQQFTSDGAPMSPVMGGAPGEAMSANEMLLLAAQQKYGLRSSSLSEGSAAGGEMTAGEVWGPEMAAAGLNLDQAKQLAKSFGLSASGPDSSQLPGPGLEMPQLTTGFDAAAVAAASGSGPCTPGAMSGRGGNDDDGEEEALPNGWMHVVDPDGRPFYFNLLTREAQWQKPAGDESADTSENW